MEKKQKKNIKEEKTSLKKEEGKKKQKYVPVVSEALIGEEKKSLENFVNFS